MQPVQHGRKALAAWTESLPTERKDTLLLRVAEDDATRVRWELLREFGGDTASQVEAGRTVAELLDAAAARRHATPNRRRTAAHSFSRRSVGIGSRHPFRYLKLDQVKVLVGRERMTGSAGTRCPCPGSSCRRELPRSDPSSGGWWCCSPCRSARRPSSRLWG